MRYVITVLLFSFLLSGCYVVETPVYPAYAPEYGSAEYIQYANQQDQINEINRWKRRQQIRSWMHGDYIGTFD